MSTLLNISASGVAIIPAMVVAAAPQVESSQQILVTACKPEGWIGVHAAEALVSIGNADLARQAFEPAADSKQKELRIGIWRVLARAESPEQRLSYIHRIRAVLMDRNAPDRIHAIEALAKLNAPIKDDVEREVVTEMANDPAVAPFAEWRLLENGDAAAGDRLVNCIKSANAIARARVCTALAYLPELSARSMPTLTIALAAESDNSPAKIQLTVLIGGPAARALTHDRAPVARYYGAMWLAAHGDAGERAAVTSLLTDADPDVRVAAALAAISIDRRTATTQPTERP